MSGKSMLVLGLAGLSGLGAMYGTSRMLASKRGPGPVEMRDVLVAARDLNVEEVIKPDAVKVVKMARASIPADGFAAPPDVEGRWVEIKMLEGEPIVNRKLAPKGNPAGLISRIPKGMRAYAIEVTEQSGVSGFVMPDHRVDVIQSMTGARGNETDAETILQNVLVLAAGQTVTRSEDKSILARTVTLAVTPEMVDSLVTAHSRGPLSLSLRGLNDHEVMEITPPPKPAEPKPTPPVVVKQGPGFLEKLAIAYSKLPALPPPPPPQLDSRITKGKRALAIEVKEQTGVSGFVLPGNRVDVIQLREGKSGGAEAVLQDVLVLSAGQTFTKADNPSIQSRTVTLEVTPEKAELLVASHSRGPLTLALRGANDRETIVKAATASPPASAPSRYLSVYRGPASPTRFQLGVPRLDVHSGPSGVEASDADGIPSREARPLAASESTQGLTP
jgi:pilus assembly protein CpaB